jgi:hypothetical protein
VEGSKYIDGAVVERNNGSVLIAHSQKSSNHIMKVYRWLHGTSQQRCFLSSYNTLEVVYCYNYFFKERVGGQDCEQLVFKIHQ